MKNQKNLPAVRRAFTLIEILIVIAIIGILATVIMTMISAAKDKAREKAYISYVVQVTKLVNDAIHVGAFDPVSPSITCLGIYTGDCYPTINGIALDVQAALEQVGTIPEGQIFPYGSGSYGTWIGPQASGVVWVGTYLDGLGSGTHEYLCNEFGWINITTGSVAGGDFCYTDLPR